MDPETGTTLPGEPFGLATAVENAGAEAAGKPNELVAGEVCGVLAAGGGLIAAVADAVPGKGPFGIENDGTADLLAGTFGTGTFGAGTFGMGPLGKPNPPASDGAELLVVGGADDMLNVVGADGATAAELGVETLGVEAAGVGDADRFGNA